MRTRKLILPLLTVTLVLLTPKTKANDSTTNRMPINRSDQSIIKYSHDDYEELISRFGKGNCDKRISEGVEYVVCYETWTSGHLRGFLHIYQSFAGKWYLCGVIIAYRQDYKITKSSRTSVTIAVDDNKSYEIPFY